MHILQDNEEYDKITPRFLGVPETALFYIISPLQFSLEELSKTWSR